MNNIEYLLRLAEQNAVNVGLLKEEYDLVLQRLAVVETKVETIEQLMWVIIIAVIGALVGQYFSHQSIKREIKNGQR